MKTGLVSKIKSLFVIKGKKIRTVKFGLLKGIKLLLDFSFQTQIYLGLWENEISGWIDKFSKDALTCIDIGAGEGVYTLYFLKKASAKNVFAFEPNNSARRILQQNIEINKPLRKCKLVLSEKYIGKLNTQNCQSLDNLITHIEAPCLIKVDVDGGELDILHGAKELLKLPGLLWVIEVHSKELESGCIELLKKAGFTVKIIPNAWWRIIIPEQRPIPSNRWVVAASRDSKII